MYHLQNYILRFKGRIAKRENDTNTTVFPVLFAMSHSATVNMEVRSFPGIRSSPGRRGIQLLPLFGILFVSKDFRSSQTISADKNRTSRLLICMGSVFEAVPTLLIPIILYRTDSSPHCLLSHKNPIHSIATALKIQFTSRSCNLHTRCLLLIF